MPELPEVETIKRDLAKYVLSQTIRSIKVIDARVIRYVTAAEFIRQLKGKRIEGIDRRGKAIILNLSSGLYFIVQPMMTGQVVHVEADKTPDVVKETKIIFRLSSGDTLLYNDQRLFGHLSLVKDLTTVKHFNAMGPEPLTKAFNPAQLAQALKKTQRAIKPLLLDHKFVAGIGNIYACEILHRAKINPKRCARDLKPGEIKVLHRQTIDVLEEAILSRGSSMRNYLDGKGQKGEFIKRIRVYAREGQPCLTCRKPIERIIQTQRSTFYCRHCQK